MHPWSSCLQCCCSSPRCIIYIYIYISIYIYTQECICACGGRRHMWAVQAKLLGGLLGGLLLSIIRSSPSTHTHMQAPHACMHALVFHGCFLLQPLKLQDLALPSLLLPQIHRQQSMTMKFFTALLALQVVPTPPNPTAHI